MVGKVSGNRKCYGVGINDCGYATQFLKEDGTKYLCPFYQRWRGVLRRIFDKKYIERFPTYTNVKICDDWLRFSNFKFWMEQQDWEGKELDKDILSKDHKIYSPDTCAFILPNTNKFLTNCSFDKIKGISFLAKRRVYRAKCGNGFGKEIFLGDFNTKDQAYNAWKEHKICVAKELSLLEKDIRIKKYLFNFEGEFLNA